MVCKITLFRDSGNGFAIAAFGENKFESEIPN